ncbi:hypothetical protein HHK36_006425 [Tetracentron sinense]|uniref:GED domain-containing protein n=1 Tax=Tetracentron sinense TaxID=13715 RepID=A0A835DKA0_TETSI|nr:hypothetical protein HHK36_006425 [Tetracentron sinense]
MVMETVAAMKNKPSSRGWDRTFSTGNCYFVGNSSSRTWRISSIFGGSESRVPSGERSGSKSYSETIHDIKHTPSVIQLREPTSLLRPSETQTEHETVEIIVTKLLLSSYYDIVRKNIQDLVPKAIMHFLVNHTKRDLLTTFIQKLYRENLFEEMLQERDEVAVKRKRTQEMFHVLKQAVQTLEEVESEVSSRNSSLSSGTDTATSFSRIPGISSHSVSNGIRSSYTSSSKNPRSRRLFYSGEQPSSISSNGEFQFLGGEFGYSTLET